MSTPSSSQVSQPTNSSQGHSRDSSSSQDASQPQTVDADGSFNASFMSNSTLADGMSGAVEDGEEHPKNKRRRTQAADKELLEEAYLKNPKPDKQARLELVKRVSMDAKAVQIWFQNRRQNDRRKSRPLSSDELASMRFHRPYNSDPAPVVEDTPPAASDPTHPASDPPRRPHSPRMPSHDLVSSQPDVTAAATPARGLVRSRSDVTDFVRQEARHHDRRDDAQEASPSSSQETPASAHVYPQGSVGSLANRRNLGSSFSTPSTQGSGRSDYARSHPVPPFSSSSQGSRLHDESLSQSQLRMSLSLDGQAQLVPETVSPSPLDRSQLLDTSPTLPQPPPQHRVLHRTQSEFTGMTLPSIRTLTEGLPDEPSSWPVLPPPHHTHGRSRDVQAWVSCAHADTRDELTALAERESTGSADAAISFLKRSSSGTLQPLGASKRNAQASNANGSHALKKFKLDRASSSVARMESVGSSRLNCQLDASYRKVTPDKDGEFLLAASPTDSDKENWTPGENGSARQAGRHRSRHPLPSTAAAATGSPRSPGQRPRPLQQSMARPPRLGNRALTAPTLHKGAAAYQELRIFEDAESPGVPVPQSDVSRFMRSPSKKGDYDGASLLMSLSKDNWR